MNEIFIASASNCKVIRYHQHSSKFFERETSISTKCMARGHDLKQLDEMRILSPFLPFWTVGHPYMNDNVVISVISDDNYFSP